MAEIIDLLTQMMMQAMTKDTRKTISRTYFAREKQTVNRDKGNWSDNNRPPHSNDDVDDDETQKGSDFREKMKEGSPLSHPSVTTTDILTQPMM